MLPRRDSKPLEYPALLPMFGGMEKKPRFLDREVITMGRARGSDFCLDGNEVSALHCIIYRAADGYRVRDCGSRTGTRVNGQCVKTGLLGNGDVLQIGPFSFEVKIPRGMESSARVDPVRVDRLNRSRSHLVHLALRLRKKLLSKPATNGHATAVTANLADSTPNDKRAAELKAKIKQYDQKVNQLEESEKELFEEQETLKKQKREFDEQFKAREAELARRSKQLDDEVQQKLKAAPVPAAPVGPSPELLAEVEKLKTKKLELDAFEKKLKARDKELNDDYKEIARERDQVEKLKQQWEQEQIDSQKEFEKQRETISSAEFTLHDQKSQLGTMIDQLRKMQEDLRASAQGETAHYERQIAQLKKELAEARQQGVAGGQHLVELDRLRVSLAEAQSEISSLTQTLQQTSGLNGEVEALQKEMQNEHMSLRTALLELEAENQQLRESSAAAAPSQTPDPRLAQLLHENETLKGLAEELQQRYSSMSEAAFDNQELEAVRSENASLREMLTKLEAADTEAALAPDAANEIRDENKVLRRLLEEAETELQQFKTAGNAAPTVDEREVEQLRNENDILHKLLHEKDKMAEEVHSMKAGAEGGASSAEVEKLQAEMQALRDRLRDREAIIEEMKQDSEKTHGGDPESYEADLNRFRKELESDRGRLNKEIESLRQRNQELDEATRELEMELSRERAEMARERIRLDRIREEVKADMERLQREQEVRGTLGSVQKLRDEIKNNAGAPGGPPKSAADRLRTMSKLP
ncbi:MAG: FHA domain-containing protein [Planctomycetota bacterium]